MNLSFMQNELVLALGWTLIHSLWQGLLLTIITGAILLATRRSDARKRYELLTGLFFIFLAVVGITFAREIYIALSHHHSSAYDLSLKRPLGIGKAVIKTLIPFPDKQILINRSWPEKFKDYFTEHASLIVMIWFVVFLARFIKLVADLAYIQRLKNYRTSEPATEWKQKLEELVQKIGISKYVQLLESGIVKVPVVMGILKPVILLPLGLLSQLPPDEIEAILLHELAHIRRRDYFVNLVQSFAETLFFFNPALMWLSSLIRDERESCCDDIAISVTNNKIKFIDALISFQEFNLAKPAYTMGFPGNKNQLLNRVKRIINKRNKTLNTTEKSILTLSIAILIMFSFVAAKNTTVSRLKKKISSTGYTKNNLNTTRANFGVAYAVSSREKAVTVNSFLAGQYQPVMHETIDTVPPADNITVIGKVRQDTLEFKSYSTSSSSDGKTSVLSITAVSKQGDEYKLSKIDDKVTELVIKGVVIDNAHIGDYTDLIAAIEFPYHQKQQHVKIRYERVALEHELELNRVKLAELDKEQNKVSSVKKMKYIDGQWTLLEPDTLLRLNYLRKQEEMKKKLSDLDKDIISQDAERQAAELKRQKLGNLNAEMKQLNMKMSAIDGNIQALKSDQSLLKNRAEQYRNTEAVYKSGKWDASRKRDVLIKYEMNRKDNMRELEMKKDQLKRELFLTERKLSVLRKTENIRSKTAIDYEMDRSQASNIRSIAEDLEKEHVNINLKNGWFVLDDKRFIVNGKTMSPEMHARFKAKYIRSHTGYFYGPVQVHGSGIIMDYRDLTR